MLPEHLKAPQVSRYAGLDVRLCQSGTSINRPARLSKVGNAYLRAALYMPAMSAIQHDQRAKAFYDAGGSRQKEDAGAMRCHAQVPDRTLGLLQLLHAVRFEQAL